MSVQSARPPFRAIKTGDYAGAAVSEGRGGSLRAQEVYLYAEALRGTGEGRFPEGDRLMVNGTVTAVEPTAPEDKNDGSLTLHYRGAVLTGPGRGRTVCEGRAIAARLCQPAGLRRRCRDQVVPGTPVSALTRGRQEPAGARRHWSRWP